MINNIIYFIQNANIIEWWRAIGLLIALTIAIFYLQKKIDKKRIKDCLDFVFYNSEPKIFGVKLKWDTIKFNDYNDSYIKFNKNLILIVISIVWFWVLFSALPNVVKEMIEDRNPFIQTTNYFDKFYVSNSVEKNETLMYIDSIWYFDNKNVSFAFDVKQLYDNNVFNKGLDFSEFTIRNIHKELVKSYTSIQTWDTLSVFMWNTLKNVLSLIHFNTYEKLGELINKWKTSLINIDVLKHNLLNWNVKIIPFLSNIEWKGTIYKLNEEDKEAIENLFEWKLLNQYFSTVWITLKEENALFWGLSWLFNSPLLSYLFYAIFIGFLFSKMGWWMNLLDTSAPKPLTEKDLKNVVDMGWNEDLKSFLDEIVALNQTTGKGVKTKGILLYWPPWTGKTLFGKQLAKRLWIWFVYVSSWEFNSSFVAWAGKKVKGFFAWIRKRLKQENLQQCVIFLDELDSIWVNRDSWRLPSDWINQLLTEIDWFGNEENIIIVGATNRLESIDGALISRFDHKVYVGKPNLESRKEILVNQLKYLYNTTTEEGKIFIKEEKLQKEKKLISWLKKFKWKNTTLSWFVTKNIRNTQKLNVLNKWLLEDQTIINKYALLMVDFTGRDIKKVVDICFNKSVLQRKTIDSKIIWEAIEEFIIWKDKKNSFDEKQLKIIGYHELWHAVLSKLVGKLVAQISIAAKSLSLWQTFSIDEENKILPSKQDLINDVLVLLGGRAAEKIFIGDITAWSSNDYERVTAILTQYILLNFDYQVQFKEQVEKILNKKVENSYKLGFVERKENLSWKEKEYYFTMLKVMIADLECLTEKYITENTTTFEYYIQPLITNLAIFWDDFELKNKNNLS